MTPTELKKEAREAFIKKHILHCRVETKLKGKGGINTHKRKCAKKNWGIYEIEDLIDRSHNQAIEQAAEKVKMMCYCRETNHTGGICPIGEAIAQALEKMKI